MQGRSVVVVGGGLVGLATAWWLQSHGHQVLLVDPQDGSCGDGSLNGSQAALGVLMAQVFQRSRGRAWRLRLQSLALWQRWRQDLESRGHGLAWRPGLLLLAADHQELERQRQLAADPQRHGLPLAIWSRDELAGHSPELPAGVGGLYSAADGQLDPQSTIRALQTDGLAAGMIRHTTRALALEPKGEGWRVLMESGGAVEAEWLLLCAGLESPSLLEPLGVVKAMEPVLGQALELEWAEAADPTPGARPTPNWSWPGAVVRGGINLVPRPDLPGGRRFWLGATLEPGIQANPLALQALRELAGGAPPWLAAARELRRWQGLRCRPVGQPAPVLEEVAPRLLLISGHYRNGVLLAPASADWARQWIDARPKG